MTDPSGRSAPSSATTAHLGRIARGGAANLLGAVVSAVAGFLLVVVVTRYFSQDTAGVLFTATSLFLILAGVAALGTDAGLARFMLRCEAQGRHRDIPIIRRVAFRPVLAVSITLCVALVALADPIAPLVGLSGDDGPRILRILAAALPFAAVATFSLASTAAFGRMRPTVVVDSILRPTLQLAAVLVVGWVGGGVLALTWAWIVPFVLSAAVSIRFASRLLTERERSWPAGEHGDPAALRSEFWHFTWPRGVARIFQIALQRVDIVLIAVLIDPAAAAVYTAATRFVVFGQFSVQAIQRVLQPRFSKMLAEDDLDTASEVFKVSTAWSMALSWPLYLGTAAAAPLYLQIFGGDYRAEGRATVVIMSFAMMAAVAAGPLDTLLLMSGRSLASLVNTGAALVIDVALCVLLIPAIGITGAAVAWAVAVVARNLLAFVQVRRHLGATPFSRASLLVAVAALVCIPLPILVLRATVGLPVVGVAVVAALGTAAYLGVLWSARRPLSLEALGSLVGGRGRAGGST